MSEQTRAERIAAFVAAYPPLTAERIGRLRRIMGFHDATQPADTPPSSAQRQDRHELIDGTVAPAASPDRRERDVEKFGDDAALNS